MPAERTNPWILPLAATAQVMLALDFAIVNVALSTIQVELRFPANGLQWVAAGYALTFGAFLLAGRRLGDRFGLRRVLLTGTVIFGVASLGGGLAPNAGWLVGSRLCQGVGAAMMAPTAFGLVSAAYPTGAARARAVSLFQGSNAVGGIAGVVVGGLLTASVGWRWVLLINAPILVVLAILVVLRIPPSPSRPETRLDLAGAVTLTVSLAALIFAVSRLEHGLADPAAVGALLLALASAVAFVGVERRSANPMVSAMLLGHRRWTVLVATMLLGATMGGYAYFLALYLQFELGLSPAATGFAFLPAAFIGLIASTWVAPQLIGRLGTRWVLALALGVLTVGQVLLARLPAQGDYVRDVLLGIIPTAVGLGLAFPAAALLVTEGVADVERGVASALFATGQQAGAAVGLAVLALAAAGRASQGTAYDNAFLLAAGFALLGSALIAALGPATHRKVRQ